MCARTMRAWLFLAATVVLEVIATLTLRASNGFSVLLPSLVSIGAYGATVVVLSFALKVIPMSVAYVIWTGLGTAGVVLFSILLFGDAMSFQSWLGVVTVVGGVIMINAHRAATDEGNGEEEEHAQRP